MIWIIFFIISVTVLLLTAFFTIIKSKVKYKSGRLLDPTKILFIGVVISATLLFIPIYVNIFKSNSCGIFEAILISLHNTIRLFVVDGEFEFITSNISGLPIMLQKLYALLFSILFVLAPILTFGFVLSFFKNISAYNKYLTNFNSDVFIFSELNEKSLALADSISKSSNDKRLMIFTDVFEKEEEQSYELLEKAKELGAIYFKKDIVTINFSLHNKSSNLSFFIIGKDQDENISQSLKIIDKLKYRDNTNLYVFSSLAEADILLENSYASSKSNNANPIKIKVHRINETHSLIVRNLYEKGYEYIFQGAYTDDNSVKRINAVVVGMGQLGTEMTKSLSWFCQMDGYLAQINSFDIDINAEEKFISLCPELMKFSGKLDIDGESKYTINIHSGIDVDTISFDDAFSKLPETTYVFVSLGNDEKNISTAIKIRRICERLGYKPKIQVVVFNNEKSKALQNITDFSGNEYDIDFIGDTKSSYSEEVIINSDIEEKALERHLQWGNEITFWQYSYNYNSSVASVIHKKMKILCKIPGIEKAPENRSEEELWAIRKLEHRRWNAYMRSQGYIYSGSKEKSTRNDLAKMHNFLVPFDELPEKEQQKDDD